MPEAGGVCISGGGTGGHVFPGLAVAAQLMNMGVPVFWMGTRNSLEEKLVRAAGIAFYSVPAAPLRGHRLVSKLRALLILPGAVLRAILLLRRQHTACVLGLGGFVSVPASLAAWFLGLPLVLQEQNAVAGGANRFLSRFAKLLLTAYPGVFPAARAQILCIGNPVRAVLAGSAQGRRPVQGRPLRILVLGGSQGAQLLNRAVPQAVRTLPQAPEIWHQSGASRQEEVRARYGADYGASCRVEPFVADMAAAYAWADVVISRAGAMVLAELAAAGLGAILVPIAQAVDAHQEANARVRTQAGGAILLEEEECDTARLGTLLASLEKEPGQLLEMGRAARRQAKPMAARRAVYSLLDLVYA